MLSKNKTKYIHSLESKKNRNEAGLFVAEGTKTVCELLTVFPCQLLVATPEWLHTHPLPEVGEVVEASREEIRKAGFMKTPQEVLAVFMQPTVTFNPSGLANSLCLALDNIQDPGNLGTIIRLADWFGIDHLFCSTHTVDVYNPKVIQATMGGIAHVQVSYHHLPELIEQLSPLPVYGTFLDGASIYDEPLSNHGLIIMGNEGNGISPEIEKLVNRRLYIPNYPPGRETTESLNVAIATSVVCAEFRRRR